MKYPQDNFSMYTSDFHFTAEKTESKSLHFTDNVVFMAVRQVILLGETCLPF